MHFSYVTVSCLGEQGVGRTQDSVTKIAVIIIKKREENFQLRVEHHYVLGICPFLEFSVIQLSRIMALTFLNTVTP